MLRTILIYLSKAEWMRRIVMDWGIARKVALRFVAGETLVSAINAVKTLNEKKMNATLDLLGEDTFTPDEAEKTAQEIIEILEAIEKSGVRSNVSIKLTQIGLNLDQDICAQNLREILARAKELNNFVRIDMEDSPFTEITLALYRQMVEEGFDNVGVVIQSYLYRSQSDTIKLLKNSTRIRMVKGAYKELPEVAFPKK
ncbi:MAG: proline dehydrogenase family protein, partial [Chloroflexota bacterium]